MTENNSTQMKECGKGVNCKHPDGPNLPISEFYTRNNGKYVNTYCIECSKADSRNQKRLPKKQAGEASEQIAVKKLRSMGIYAVAGKASEFNHVDVVARGCVRIEVKFSDKKSDGTFTFAFTSQRKQGIKADLVLLIKRDGDDITFHLFPASHPVFFKRGKVKNALAYMPYVHHRKNGVYLSPSLMSEFKDKWELIQQKQDEIEALLITNDFDPKRVTRAEVYERTLFE